MRLITDEEIKIPFKFNVPKIFENKIYFQCSCQLSDNEINTFNTALSIMEEQLNLDKIELDEIPVIFFFIGSENFYIKYDLTDNHIGGQYLNAIIYRIDIHRNNFEENNAILLRTYIHEMCHCYYKIFDEQITKNKTSEILIRFCS